MPENTVKLPQFLERPAETLTLPETTAALPDDANWFLNSSVWALISGGLGIGKTRVWVGYIDEDGVKHPGALHLVKCQTLMVFPTIEKAREAFEEYLKNAPPGAPPALLLIGRNEETCLRPGTFRAASVGEVSGMAACRACHWLRRCKYIKLKAANDAVLETGDPCVVFGTHAHAFGAAPQLIRPETVIVDENAAAQAIRENLIFAASLKGPLPKQKDADENASIALAAVRKLLDDLFYAGTLRRPILGAMRAAGWTSKAIADALAAIDAYQDRATAAQLAKIIDHPLKDYAAEVGKVARLINGAGARRVAFARDALRALAVEIDREDDEATGLRWLIDGTENFAGVKVVNLIPPAFPEARTMFLDGTGDADLIEQIFGKRPVHLSRQAPRKSIEEGHIYSFVSGRFSKTAILGLVADQKTGARLEGPYNVKKQQFLAKAIRKEAAIGPTLVIANAEVKAKLQTLLADCENVEFGHFNAVRGINKWEGLNRVVVIGQPLPRAEALEDVARAIHARRKSKMVSVAGSPELEFVGDHARKRFGSDGPGAWSYLQKVVNIEMTSGHAVSISENCHPDPIVDLLLWQATKAEILQSIARIRPVWKNSVSIRIFGVQELGFAFDSAQTEAAEAQGGTRVQRAAFKAVLPLSVTKLVEAFPEIWANKMTAQRDLADLEIDHLLENKEQLRKHSPQSILQDLTERLGVNRLASPEATVRMTFGRFAAVFLIEYKTREKRARSSRAVVWADDAGQAFQVLEERAGALVDPEILCAADLVADLIADEPDPLRLIPSLLSEPDW